MAPQMVVPSESIPPIATNQATNEMILAVGAAPDSVAPTPMVLGGRNIRTNVNTPQSTKPWKRLSRYREESAIHAATYPPTKDAAIQTTPLHTNRPILVIPSWSGSRSANAIPSPKAVRTMWMPKATNRPAMIAGQRNMTIVIRSRNGKKAMALLPSTPSGFYQFLAQPVFNNDAY